MKVAVVTLGCKVNAYESELIKERFLKNGDVLVDEMSRADVIVINTCTVTNTADAKSRHAINQARRLNERAILVVCGCSAENHKEKLFDLDIDILIGNKDKTKIVDLVEEFKRHHEKISRFYDLRNVSFEDMQIANFAHKTRGFVKIQDGCDNFCAYCIIPFMRGNIRSKDIAVAEAEVKCLAQNGYQEIVLTGIHTGSYGRNEDYDLVDLIRRISQIPEIKRIRLSSIEITELSDKFMQELRDNPKLCDHLHIPIQSGADAVLKNMGRKYDIREFKAKVKAIRALRPEINLTTDLIVGFPLESDADFAETLQNVREIGFSKIHTFPYSMRSGTKASTMPNVADAIKKARTQEMLTLSDELERQYNRQFLNREVEVLVEENNTGLTSNYLKVQLDREEQPNTFVKVLITDVYTTYVKGHVV